MAGKFPVRALGPGQAVRQGVRIPVRADGPDDPPAAIDGLLQELRREGLEDIVLDGPRVESESDHRAGL
jgi:hypothetical protein